jgi:hypothetical protein
VVQVFDLLINLRTGNQVEDLLHLRPRTTRKSSLHWEKRLG